MTRRDIVWKKISLGWLKGDRCFYCSIDAQTFTFFLRLLLPLLALVYFVLMVIEQYF